MSNRTISEETMRLWRMKGWEKDKYETMLNPFFQVFQNLYLGATAYAKFNQEELVDLRIVPKLK